MPSEPPHENWKVTDEWSYYLAISNFEDAIRLHAQQFWKFVSICLGILLSKTDSVQPGGKYNTRCDKDCHKSVRNFNMRLEK